MADDDKVVSVGISHRSWLGAVAFSAVIVLLVAIGVTDYFGMLTIVMLGILLFLFGLAEIMRYVGESDDRRGTDQ